jgi:superfamily I DNA/RNA helicase
MWQCRKHPVQCAALIAPYYAADIEDDIRLTYVAITRATHEAFITYSNMSELVGRLVV